MTGGYTAIPSPAIDAAIDGAIAGIGAAIGAMGIPHMEGVVLGGGYGRGEGGVRRRPGLDDAPCNDLDFYVVADDSSSPSDLAAIGAALEPLAAKWSRSLGVDADFSPAKTYWRMKHDEARLMIQELIRGYRDVAGKPGTELFAGLARRRPEETPLAEAVRLLMNRGAGLLLAKEGGRGADFVARNINKAVLGAGDARLIARHDYAWRIGERAGRLSEPLYSAAAEWKAMPQGAPVCDWESARDSWLAAEAEVRAALRGSADGRRSLYHAARWIVRRRTIGPAATFGLDPSLRVMLEIGRAIRAGAPFTAPMARDWRTFN